MANPYDYGNPAPDSLYTTQKQNNQTAYEAAMAKIAAQRASTASEYGFDANTGAAADNVDVSNPFSRAAMLNRSYAQNQAASSNSYANRGLLTSGAYASAVGEDARGYAQGTNALQSEFAQRLADFRNSETDSQTSLQTGNTGAYGELMGRRMQQDAAVTDPTPSPAAPAAPPSVNDALGLPGGSPTLPKVPKGGPTKVTRSYVNGVLNQAQLKKYGFKVGSQPAGFTAEIKFGKFVRWIAPGGK